MVNYSMKVSEDLLNNFVDTLLSGVDAIHQIGFDLHDGYFYLNIDGKQYVNYSLRAEFTIVEVDYEMKEQTIVFNQRGETDIRGRFPFGGYLEYLVDEPLKDYMCGFDFVEFHDGDYIFNLRRSDITRGFFDDGMLDHSIPKLFPFDDLLVRPSKLIFIGAG